MKPASRRSIDVDSLVKATKLLVSSKLKWNTALKETAPLQLTYKKIIQLQRSSMNTTAGETISEDDESVEVFVLPILPMQWTVRIWKNRLSVVDLI